MASTSPLSKANIRFTLDQLKLLSKTNNSSNVFFSPMSVSSALSMVLLGARGHTATQIAECLKTTDCKDVHSSFASLLLELNQPDNSFALNVANRLYGEQSYQFMKDFLKKTKQFYDADLETVDFLQNAEVSRVNINTWVEKKTEGKIKDLLKEDAVDSLTKLVLVNAIYFKANWADEFWDRETIDAKFRLSKNDSKTVKMMHNCSCFELRQIKDISCRVLKLPYRGGLSMLILLPDDIEDSTTGLEKLEQQLTYEKFVEWTSQDKMSAYQVDLSLPRFRIEENYELTDSLKNMGMEDAFDESKCDFSGMSSAKDLVLSKVVHKTFVSVDEKGTEAAAATACSLCGCCGAIPVPFVADHPFLFFIQHDKSNTVLFAGRCCCPEW